MMPETPPSPAYTIHLTYVDLFTVTTESGSQSLFLKCSRGHHL